MEKDEQALLLLTNRILLDYLSIKVSEGTYKRAAVEALVRFSEEEVIKAAPWLQEEVRQFAALTRERLAEEPSADDRSTS